MYDVIVRCKWSLNQVDDDDDDDADDDDDDDDNCLASVVSWRLTLKVTTLSAGFSRLQLSQIGEGLYPLKNI